ncbi:MAG: DEAD/DEAH box helicase [Acidobacteriia bacterium]|nr:DEAD/DEAH box helicase [Terriglobia bacterium]
MAAQKAQRQNQEHQSATAGNSKIGCAAQASKVLLLTGTPLVNRPSDIAPLLNMIVKDHIRLTVPTGLWSSRVFTDIPTDEGFVRAFGEDGLNAVGRAVWKELLPCVLSHFQPERTPDFPTMTTETVKVPMTPEQATVYRAWETQSLTRSMVAMLSRQTSVPPDLAHLPRFRAYLDGGRRICNMVQVQGHTYAPKFARLLDLLEQNPGPALVFSHYLNQGVRVAEDLLRERGITYVLFTGQETDRQKKEAVERYNRQQVRVFLSSPAGGVGLDLHDTVSVHIMEPGWNEALILQAIYRAVRYKSHSQPQAVVKVYRYYCYRRVMPLTTPLPPSADVYLMEVSRRKERVNQRFLEYALQHSMEQSDVGQCVVEGL